MSYDPFIDPETGVPIFRIVKSPIRLQFGHRIANAGPLELPDFATAREKVFAPFFKSRLGGDDRTIAALSECDSRLIQLDFVIRRVDRLQLRSKRAGTRRPNSAGRINSRISTELELLTEMFYYVAFRFQQLAQNVLKLGYDPTGIRNVRNHLIEHAERHGAPAPNFVWGYDLPWGPILRPYGNPERETHDDGLYVNAQQAIDALVRAIEKEMSERA